MKSGAECNSRCTAGNSKGAFTFLISTFSFPISTRLPLPRVAEERYSPNIHLMSTLTNQQDERLTAMSAAENCLFQFSLHVSEHRRHLHSQQRVTVKVVSISISIYLQNKRGCIVRVSETADNLKNQTAETKHQIRSIKSIASIWPAWFIPP